jgi:nitroreductase / dihydropteridine reductase
MEFKEIVDKRYACKLFDGKKIPQAKVDELMNIIRKSASSFNLQPWKIRVITDDGTKQKLKPASWDQPQIATCSHLLVFCAYSDIEKRILELQKLMLVSGKDPKEVEEYINYIRGSKSGLDRETCLKYTQNQVYIALGNALNGAKSLGFDSCPMEGFSPKKYSEILNLPNNLVPTVICPIGYAADSPNPKIRFSSEDIFF